MEQQRKIYLVHHGAIEVGNSGRFIGQIDLPLSEDGIIQAKRIQMNLSCIKLSNIFCSDLQRALQTACIIAERRPIKPEIRTKLREISFGEWEGKRFDEIHRKYPKEFKERGNDIANFLPPGGESFAECSKRVVIELDDIVKNTSGSILIVGHNVINRIIISHILGIPLDKIFTFCQDYGCLNLINYNRSRGFHLERLNHLNRSCLSILTDVPVKENGITKNLSKKQAPTILAN